MCTRKILILFLFSAGLSGPVLSQGISLQGCLESARMNYPLVKQYALLEKSRDYNLQNAGKMYLPQLSLNAIGGHVFGGLPALTLPGTAPEEKSDFQFIGLAQLNQVIWDGGSTHAQKNILKNAAEAEKAQVDVTLYAIRERVCNLYLGVLMLDEQSKQLQSLSDLLEKNLRRVQLLQQNGLALSNDEDEIQVEKLKLEQRRTELLFAREAYLSMLSFFIHQELAPDTRLELPATPASLSDDIQRPELLLFERQKVLNESQNAMNTVGLMPRIGLMGAGLAFAPGIKLGLSEMKSVVILGLNLSWSTQGIYRKSNNTELNRINTQKIDLQREQFLFNTALLLRQQKAELDKKNSLISQDEAIVELRARITKAYQLRYETGSSPLSDLLTAGDRETEARSALALHRLEVLLSKINYANTTGH